MTESVSTISGNEPDEGSQRPAAPWTIAWSKPRRVLAVTQKVWRGPSVLAAWERPSLLILLCLSSALYFWNLDVNGWSNSYYSAAVQAGTMDWKAFFFGSSDWGNSITVDKPPLSLWVMGSSARLFGLSPVAMLAPQAAMGVCTTLLIYVLIRRFFSGAAALMAGATFASTPIITLMSRYNNPDPLMVLLMVAGAYLVVRTIESGLARYFIWAGALLGLAFMTKQLQGLLSLPALAAGYLCFSGIHWAKRLQVAIAGVGAMIVTGGFWTTLVDISPPNSRPFIGGSTSNSVLQLTLGYNGIDRVISKENPSIAALVPGEFRTVSSDAGIFRLLNPNYAQEATWLLFSALLGSILVIASWKYLAKSRAAAALIVITVSWLYSTYLVLSFMGDQIHTYYTAALAPPLALTAGLVVEAISARRSSAVHRIAGAAVTLIGIITCWLILSGLEFWPPWIATAMLSLGTLGVSLIAVQPQWRNSDRIAYSCAVIAILVGPSLTSVYTATVAHSGSNPLSGVLTKNPATISHFMSQVERNELVAAHDAAYGTDPSARLVEVLSDAKDCTWAGATYPSQTAARLQLAAQRPVMAIGGFMGADPAPSLDDFRHHVSTGDICYFVDNENYLGAQTEQTNAAIISTWVRSQYFSEVIDGATVYDLRSSLEKGQVRNSQ